MRVSFACPSCDAKGSADSVHVGKSVRCRHCGADFTIPRPEGESRADDVYALEEPAHAPAAWVPEASNQGAVFVPSRSPGGESSGRPARAKAEAAVPRARKGEPSFPWRTWLIRCGIGAAAAIGLIALLAPHGLWLSGCILMVIGGLMILVGFAAGAYGAFQEDVLYGLLYLGVPFYTAYYIVTRWDDLWAWFACSTVGVGVSLIGIEFIRWAGAPI